MEVSTVPLSGCPHEKIVFLRGEFDLSRGDEIVDLTRRALADPAVELVVLDLADTTFLDAYSLGQLVRAHRLATRRHTGMIVAHADCPIVRHILEITGIMQSFAPASDDQLLRRGPVDCPLRDTDSPRSRRTPTDHDPAPSVAAGSVVSRIAGMDPGRSVLPRADDRG